MSLWDILAVNGKPAKGTWVVRGMQVFLRPDPMPGQAIADVNRGNYSRSYLEILQPDGTPVGTIVSDGLFNGPPPPGAPSSALNSNCAVTGGTGAFYGVRGQLSTAQLTQLRPRGGSGSASVTEDPSKRRTFGNGTRIRIVLKLTPMAFPRVQGLPETPAIFHGADFTLVSPARPASPGELLIIQATGLGATVPGVDPGRPFPAEPLQEVSAPLEVQVNGKPAAVINKIGWPGRTDVYRVDFRLPSDITPGLAAIQLIAAWIPGPETRIPIR